MDREGRVLQQRVERARPPPAGPASRAKRVGGEDGVGRGTATPSAPCVARRSGLEPGRQAAAERRQPPRRSRSAPGTTAASSPRGCPRRRPPCRAAACRYAELLATLATEKSRRDEGVHQAARRRRPRPRRRPAPRPRRRRPATRRAASAPAADSPSCAQRSANASSSANGAELGDHRAAIGARAERSLARAGVVVSGRHWPDAFSASATSWRHVALVVLGQHLARLEHAVGAEGALRHHALALAEQVGQVALEHHRAHGDLVGHLEADHAAGVAGQAAALHQAADADRCGRGARPSPWPGSGCRRTPPRRPWRRATAPPPAPPRARRRPPPSVAAAPCAISEGTPSPAR